MNGMPLWTWWVAAVLYFICPIDLSIIDVPVLGWWDDALFAYWCYGEYQKAKVAEAAHSCRETPTIVYPLIEEDRSVA